MSKNLYSLYKKGHWCVKKKIPLLPQILTLVKRFAFPACDVPFTCEIGEGTVFPHRAIGVVGHARASIGKNARIETNVCIGGVAGKGVPTIGDNVLIGTGASVLGGITVGDHCIIGAGAVVVDDLPPYSVAVGVPARIIKTLPHE